MAKTERQISEVSVSSLLIQMRVNGTDLASGTAFVAMTGGRPVLITNRHNVTGRHPETGQPLSPTGGLPDEVVITHNRLNDVAVWVERAEPLYEDAHPLWVEHPKLGPGADFVALPLTQTDDVQFYPYNPAEPGEDIAVGPADPVSVVGFPFGEAAGGSLAIWATGFMASEPDVDYDGLPIFLIDCRSREGQSGSPVVAFRSSGAVGMLDGSVRSYVGPIHRFLGIYSGRISRESDIGLVWKASAIAELLASI